MMRCKYSLCGMSGLVTGVILTDSVHTFYPVELPVERLYELYAAGKVKISTTTFYCPCRADYLNDRNMARYTRGEIEKYFPVRREQFTPLFFDLKFGGRNQLIFRKEYYNYSSDVDLTLGFLMKFNMLYHGSDKEHAACVEKSRQILNKYMPKLKVMFGQFAGLESRACADVDG